MGTDSTFQRAGLENWPLEMRLYSKGGKKEKKMTCNNVHDPHTTRTTDEMALNGAIFEPGVVACQVMKWLWSCLVLYG